MAKTALSEYKSKKLVEKYGILVPPEFVVSSQADAQKAARELGYPVVLKGVSSKILHKTEAGIVVTGIWNDASLAEAYSRVASAGGRDLEGISVQKQVVSKREFIAGILRDDQFGYCVMFGIGGVTAEVIDEVIFRVAPVDEIDVEEAVGENRRLMKLLAPFRGEPAVEMREVCRTIKALSEIPFKEKGIMEIDLNPLMPLNGKLCAVDALVIVDE
jgi:succinyl-CoA synthetase beta subunit